MEGDLERPGLVGYLSNYWLILPLVSWGVLALSSAAWNWARLDDIATSLAFERGRSMFQLVEMARLWNARHGGVYVPLSKTTPSNPYLDIPDRDVVTRGGVALTKLNPAYMTREIADVAKDASGILFHITSLKPINPGNKADPWETRALDSFEKGAKERLDLVAWDSGQYFRYMAPLEVKTACMKCHEQQGYRVGDIRGGISVTLPAEPLLVVQTAAQNQMIMVHAIAYLLLCMITSGLLWKLCRQWDALVQTKRRLAGSQRFLAGVTDNMGEGCMVMDGSNQLVFLNPEGERILGYKADELKQENLHRRLHLGDDGRVLAEADCPINQTIGDGKRREVPFDRFLHRDGSLIPVEYIVNAYKLEDVTEFVIVCFKHIRSRLEMEETRRRLERELNQTHKLEAIGQLAGGISHEINTPMQYIKDNLGFLGDANADYRCILEAYRQLLEQAKEVPSLQAKAADIAVMLEQRDVDYLNDEVPKAIEQSINGAAQVVRLVGAMKDFAHPGSNKMEPEDINKLILNTLTISKNEWKLLADIDTQLADDLPKVDCYRGEISQVLLNLIVNATHAIEATGRGEKGRITVISEFAKGVVKIRVSDTGVGIKDEHREHLFNPFFTTKEVGKGSGQGLAIARDIVAVKHHGRLYFESVEGTGTTFFVELPAGSRGSEAPEPVPDVGFMINPLSMTLTPLLALL